MSPHVPAEAGWYSVELAVPGDLEWCEETRGSVVAYLGKMADEKRADLLHTMPSIQVAPLDDADDAAELIMQWVEQPGQNAWDAIEKIVDDVVKVVMPDLLRKSLAIRVLATCERSVGRDVELPDEDN